MKVEIAIDRKKPLPDGAVPDLEKELLRRLNQSFTSCSLIIRRTGTDGLSLFGGMGIKSGWSKSFRTPGKVLTTGSIE